MIIVVHETKQKISVLFLLFVANNHSYGRHSVCVSIISNNLIDLIKIRHQFVFFLSLSMNNWMDYYLKILRKQQKKTCQKFSVKQKNKQMFQISACVCVWRCFVVKIFYHNHHHHHHHEQIHFFLLPSDQLLLLINQSTFLSLTLIKI